MKKLFLGLLILLCLFGCSKKVKEPDLDLQALQQEINEKYVDTYTTKVEMNEFLRNVEIEYTQINQFNYERAFLDTKCDELALIRIVDEKNADVIVAYLEKHLNDVIDEFTGYIDSEAQIAKKGEVIQKGTYIFLVISEDVDNIKADILKKFDNEE